MDESVTQLLSTGGVGRTARATPSVLKIEFLPVLFQDMSG